MDLMQIGAFYVSALFFFIFSIPVHELGHLVFGRMTGYRFVSFSLFSLVFTREGGKLRLLWAKHKTFAGQCLMAPPKDEKRFQYVLYNVGGGLFNFLCAGILFLLYGMAEAGTFYHSAYLVGCMVSATMGLVNLAPMDFGVPNDGHNVLMASKSAEAKHGLFVMLTVNDETSSGRRLRDFDEAFFATSENADLSNYMVAYLVICRAERLYDLGDYAGCAEICEMLVRRRLQPYYANSVLSLLLYHAIMHEPDYEKAKIIHDRKDMTKHLRMGFPAVNRIISAYTFFVERDRSVGRRMLEKTRQLNENYPNRAIREMELDYLAHLEAAMDRAEAEIAAQKAQEASHTDEVLPAVAAELLPEAEESAAEAANGPERTV